jgi:hypothetical protein
VCKCRATTYQGHIKKVQKDGYPAHVYTGYYWAPKDDEPDGGHEEYVRSMEAGA